MTAPRLTLTQSINTDRSASIRSTSTKAASTNVDPNIHKSKGFLKNISKAFKSLIKTKPQSQQKDVSIEKNSPPITQKKSLPSLKTLNTKSESYNSKELKTQLSEIKTTCIQLKEHINGLDTSTLDKKIEELQKIISISPEQTPEIDTKMKEINKTLNHLKLHTETKLSETIVLEKHPEFEDELAEMALPKTQQEKFHEFLGIKATDLINQFQVKEDRDAKDWGSYAIQSIVGFIPGSLSSQKADQAHKIAMKTANIGTQNGSVKTIFDNTPESKLNRLEEIGTQTKSGIISTATRLICGILDTTTGVVATAFRYISKTENYKQTWNNRGHIRRSIYKSLFKMGNKIIKQAQTKDLSTKRNINFLKQKQLIGTLPYQIKSTSDPKLALKITLFNTIKTNESPPSKIDLHNSIHKSQDQVEDKKELTELINNLTDEEIKTIHIATQDTTTQECLEDLDLLSQVKTMNEFIHNDTIQKLISYINESGEDLDASTIPEEQMAELFKNEVFLPEENSTEEEKKICDQKNKDVEILKKLLKPKYRQSLLQAAQQSLPINTKKETLTRKLQKNIQKLETASNNEKYSIQNKIKQNIQELFKEIKKEKEVIHKKTTAINDEILSINKTIEKITLDKLKPITPLSENCSPTEIDKKMSEINETLQILKKELNQQSSESNIVEEKTDYIEKTLQGIHQATKEGINTVKSVAQKTSNTLSALVGREKTKVLTQLDSLHTQLTTLKSDKTILFEDEKKYCHTLINTQIIVDATKNKIENQYSNRTLDTECHDEIEGDIKGVIGRSIIDQMEQGDYELIQQDIIQGLDTKYEVIEQQPKLRHAFSTLFENKSVLGIRAFKSDINQYLTDYFKSSSSSTIKTANKLKTTLKAINSDPEYFNASFVTDKEIKLLDELSEFKSKTPQIKTAFKTIKDFLEANKSLGVLRTKAESVIMMHTGSAAIQVGISAGGGIGIGLISQSVNAISSAAGLSKHVTQGVALSTQKYATTLAGDQIVVGTSQLTNKTKAPILDMASSATKYMKNIQDHVINQLKIDSQQETSSHINEEKKILLTYLYEKQKVDQILEAGLSFEETKQEMNTIKSQGFDIMHKNIMTNHRILTIYSSLFHKSRHDLTKQGHIHSEQKHDMEGMDRAMKSFNSELCGLSTISLFPKSKWEYLTKKCAAANLNLS